MFDTKTTLTERLTDAVDLLMDFATLGEYGLEPVGRTPRRCKAEINQGPLRKSARDRGVRGASGAPSACGVAWQRHASRATAV
jgi:hypothetical protein